MRDRKIEIILEAEDLKSDKKKKDPSSEKIEKSLMDKLVNSEDLTDALDVVSAIGVGTEAAGAMLGWTGVGAAVAAGAAAVSAAADTINALRMAKQGKTLQAGMYAIFAIPVFGDVLQGAKIAGAVGEGGVKIIARLIKLAKTKKVEKAVETVGKLVDKAPGGDSHKAVVKKAAGTLLSGDSEAIAKLAEDSGESALADAIRKSATSSDPDDSSKKDLAESRRHRSLLPLYKGSLYK